MSALSEMVRCIYRAFDAGACPQVLMVDFDLYAEGFMELAAMRPDGAPWSLEDGLIPNYALCGIPVVPI
jgi:hypothetical protein